MVKQLGACVSVAGEARRCQEAQNKHYINKVFLRGNPSRNALYYMTIYQIKYQCRPV